MLAKVTIATLFAWTYIFIFKFRHIKFEKRKHFEIKNFNIFWCIDLELIRALLVLSVLSCRCVNLTYNFCMIECSIVEQWIKLPATLASFISVGSSTSCSPSNPDPWQCIWESNKDGSSPWTLIIPVGNLDGVWESWVSRSLDTFLRKKLYCLGIIFFLTDLFINYIFSCVIKSNYFRFFVFL